MYHYAHTIKIRKIIAITDNYSNQHTTKLANDCSQSEYPNGNFANVTFIVNKSSRKRKSNNLTEGHQVGAGVKYPAIYPA